MTEAAATVAEDESYHPYSLASCGFVLPRPRILPKECENDAINCLKKGTPPVHINFCQGVVVIYCKINPKYTQKT